MASHVKSRATKKTRGAELRRQNRNAGNCVLCINIGGNKIHISMGKNYYSVRFVDNDSRQSFVEVIKMSFQHHEKCLVQRILLAGTSQRIHLPAWQPPTRLPRSLIHQFLNLVMQKTFRRSSSRLVSERAEI